MTLERIPSFGGSLVSGSEYFVEDFLNGLFYMFIDEREPTQQPNIRKIKGSIEDLLGSSTFEGEISPTFIKFTKKYDKEAIAVNGAAPEEVNYSGELYDGEFYEGTYTVVNGTIKGVKGDWQGRFVMWPTVDEERN